VKKVKAFTLIELLIVVVIIGILAALVVLSLTSARAKAKDARAKSAVSDVATAVEMYINDNEGTAAYPTSGSALVGTASSIGSYLKSKAVDATGEAVLYKITSPTQYGVVGLAADGGCWYTSSGISGRTNNLSNTKSTVSTNPACSISNY